MPGLLRGIARTAAVAGTATAVSNRVSRRQARRWSEQSAPEPEQQYYEAPPQAAPEPSPDRIEQLTQLADLKDRGILTEVEFAAEKMKILGSDPRDRSHLSGFLKIAPPPPQDRVDGGGADDRLRRRREGLRVQEERSRLQAAEASVEADQLFEGAAFLELGVIEAADHDVGDVGEAVGAQQVYGRGRRRAPAGRRPRRVRP